MDGEEKREQDDQHQAAANPDAVEERREDQSVTDESPAEVSVTEELASGEAVAGGEDSPPERATASKAKPAKPPKAKAENVVDEAGEAEEEAAAKPRKIKKPEVEADDEILEPDEAPKDWYILKVAFNREETVRDAIVKQIKMSGLDGYFGDVLVPTEDIVEFTRSGKRKIVKRKLYPGYLMIFMHVNDDTWFLVRDTTGVSDFTGTAGKPSPMDPEEVERVIRSGEEDEDGEKQLKTSIPFKVGERVRVKEGNFQNQEGEVDKLDEANGRISVNINIFGRSVPVELDHWQVEPL